MSRRCSRLTAANRAQVAELLLAISTTRAGSYWWRCATARSCATRAGGIQMRSRGGKLLAQLDAQSPVRRPRWAGG
jgi:hypothetical protein